MLARLRCYLRGWHEPLRHPLGGFRCADCGTPSGDLHGMGFQSHVAPLRKLFSRDGEAIERTTVWETRELPRRFPRPARKAAVGE